MTDRAGEPAAHPPGRRARLRLRLGYDGSGFAGWARQPGQRTVQGVLEDVLAHLLGTPVATTAAGRTDAGVHASGQVAHADLAALPAAGPPSPRRVNRALPDDVRVQALDVAPAGFDARFCALSRTYRYRVTDAVADPLRRHDTLEWPRPLDLSRLHAASRGLLGEHDFAAYCRRREGATTIRTLQRLDWERDDAGVLVATVQADAFCHAMVRSLAGALLAVGDGRWEPARPAALLRRGERAQEVVVAPAHGLTLVGVDYPPDEALAERAEQTRRLRTVTPARTPAW